MERSIVGLTAAMVHYFRRPPHSISPARAGEGTASHAAAPDPTSSATPNPNTSSAAANSNPRAITATRESSPAAKRIARPLAKTAAQARAPVVSAVPRDIAKTAATPAGKTFLAKEKTRTKMAPEQGLDPAATTVAAAPRQENPSPRRLGSGAWS